MLHRMKTMMVVLVAMALTAGSVSAQLDEALKAVPASATVVVIVPNPQQLDTDFQAFLADCGIRAKVPTIAEALAKKGVKQGVNLSKPFIFFVAGMPEGKPEPIGFILGTTDYQALIAPFKPVEEEGLTAVTCPKGKGYCFQQGEFIVCSPSRALIEEVKAGKGLANAAALTKAAAGTDVYVWIDFKAYAPLVQAQIAQASNMMGMVLQGQSKQGPGAAAMFQGVFKALSDLVGQVETITLIGNLEKDGISIRAAASVTPDGSVAKWLARQPAGQGGLLADMPGGAVLLAGGTRFDPQSLADIAVWAMDIMKSVPNAADKIDPAELDKLTAQMVKMYKTVTRWSMVMLRSKPGQGFISLAGVADVGDAKAILDTIAELTPAYTKMQQELGLSGGMKMTIKRAAETVDGHSVDHFSYVFPPPPAPKEGETPMPPMFNPTQIMTMIFGPEGMLTRMTAVGEGKVVWTLGGGQELIKEAIAAAKAGNDLGKAGPMTKVSAKLPTGRQGELFLEVDEFVRMGAGLIAMFSGQPLQVPLPGDVMPVGLSLTCTKTGAQVDLYVPTELVKEITTFIHGIQDAKKQPPAEEEEVVEEEPAPKGE